jgi:hypothetical protein
MTEEDILIGPEDIERDLEGSRKAEARIAAFFRRGEGAGHVRTRGGSGSLAPSPEETPGGIGRQLMARCPSETQQRYRTLVHFERAMPADGDFAILIAAACAILEAELRRLLASPARPIVNGLLAALDPKKQRKQVDLLDKWARGAIPTTLGSVSLLVFALRRGAEMGLPEVGRFLAERFRPRFAELLRSRRMDGALESIRTRFRNPADHAERTFDAAAYGEFVRLVIANRLFAAWDTDGPDPSDPDAGSGILYHHLRHALGDSGG